MNLEKLFSGFTVDRDHVYLKFLEEAEAKGKFRRLTSLDEVGWDNPIWKSKKVPRYWLRKTRNHFNTSPQSQSLRWIK